MRIFFCLKSVRFQSCKIESLNFFSYEICTFLLSQVLIIHASQHLLSSFSSPRQLHCGLSISFSKVTFINYYVFQYFSWCLYNHQNLAPYVSLKNSRCSYSQQSTFLLYYLLILFYFPFSSSAIYLQTNDIS